MKKLLIFLCVLPLYSFAQNNSDTSYKPLPDWAYDLAYKNIVTRRLTTIPKNVEPSYEYDRIIPDQGCKYSLTWRKDTLQYPDSSWQLFECIYGKARIECKEYLSQSYNGDDTLYLYFLVNFKQHRIRLASGEGMLDWIASDFNEIKTEKDVTKFLLFRLRELKIRALTSKPKGFRTNIFKYTAFSDKLERNIDIKLNRKTDYGFYNFKVRVDGKTYRFKR